MILLDTNVLSEFMRENPEPAVVNWLDEQAPESIWTTAVTVFEICFGLELLPAGRRRMRLVPSKWATLRVARTALRAVAMPAIIRSRISNGRPSRCLCAARVEAAFARSIEEDLQGRVVSFDSASAAVGSR